MWSEGRAACLCAGNSASGGRRGLVRHEEAQGTVRNRLGVDSREWDACAQAEGCCQAPSYPSV